MFGFLTVKSPYHQFNFLSGSFDSDSVQLWSAVLMCQVITRFRTCIERWSPAGAPNRNKTLPRHSVDIHIQTSQAVSTFYSHSSEIFILFPGSIEPELRLECFYAVLHFTQIQASFVSLSVTGYSSVAYYFIRVGWHVHPSDRKVPCEKCVTKYRDTNGVLLHVSHFTSWSNFAHWRVGYSDSSVR